VRLGSGGPEASLTEGELMRGGLDVFAGLAADPAGGGAAAAADAVVLSGVPTNPPAALGYRIKQVLELARTPDVIVCGGGKVMLELGCAADLQKVQQQQPPGSSFKLLGVQVAVVAP
jgi:hypothetical protein